MALVLRDLHLSLGARFSESGEVADYGDAGSELAALRGACALVDRSRRGILRVTGSERASYLHGLVTNEVKALAPGRGCYAAALTAKGKLVADLRLLARGGELWLDTEPEAAAPLRTHLEHYLISEDAELADASGDWALLAVVGPRSVEAVAAALGGPPAVGAEHSFEEREGTLAIGVTLGGESGVELAVPVPKAPELGAKLAAAVRAVGGTLVGWSAMELARVEAGTPRFGRDLTEESLLLEAGLGEKAVSFNKGCYVGQEVIARAQFRGVLKRRLCGFSVEGEVGSLPAELFAEGDRERVAGVLTSTAMSPRFGSIALGYARREHPAGTALRTAAGARAVVRDLPFKAP